MGNAISIILLLVAVFFFIGGTVGLLRFPDVYCRLHALTKADNIGLGCVVLALMIQATSWDMALKLLLVWIFVMAASATNAYLIARAAIRKDIPVWKPSKRE